jgi:hypothetical protein
MKSIPAKKEHFELLDLRDIETETLAMDTHGLEKCMALVDISIALTMVHKGIVLGIMGYYQLWPGVLEVWILPSKHIAENKFVYLRTVRRHIDQLVKTPGVHRLQTTCINDDLHTSWMDFLGFLPEGCMAQYSSDKKDYVMWSRITGGY